MTRRNGNDDREKTTAPLLTTSAGEPEFAEIGPIFWEIFSVKEIQRLALLDYS
jgi:hypothetical protein